MRTPAGRRRAAGFSGRTSVSAASKSFAIGGEAVAFNSRVSEAGGVLLRKPPVLLEGVNEKDGQIVRDGLILVDCFAAADGLILADGIMLSDAYIRR